ncbi:MAG: helix-turn-helix domain-containing protein [Pirellulales bacterium]|nr:helix-turn-helix domain-containing protein [Pirellulales bacterium]
MNTIQSKPDATLESHPLAGGLMTIEQAGKLLALGKSTLYEAMERGELPYCKVGRARRIPRLALLEWAAAQMTGGWAIQPQRRQSTVWELTK